MTLNELESASIRDRQSSAQASVTFDGAEWVSFGLSVLPAVGETIRRTRLQPLKQLVTFKPDGSPVTTMEQEIEAFVQDRLTSFCPGAAFVGEETHGMFPTSGIAIALDPVDGTWSLVNRSETCATSLAGYRDGKCFLGMVLNPVTGELAYATNDTTARLIQFSMFGDDDRAYSLPVDQARPESILVNVHPHKNVKALVSSFYEKWNEGGVNMVKSPGGSPAWAMLEAAKGSFVYVNLWSQRPAEPYDLAAGVMLVRGAGGDATDLDGSSIHELDHKGPFIAGIDEEARNRVAAIVRDTLKSTS